jgi:hypothetical protein
LVIDEVAKTINIGTPEYMAPELIDEELA